jgi:hypothetical protein
MSWARTKIASNSPPSDAVRARSPRALDRQAGVGEQLARVVGEAAFVGKGDAEHEAWARARVATGRGRQNESGPSRGTGRSGRTRAGGPLPAGAPPHASHAAAQRAGRVAVVERVVVAAAAGRAARGRHGAERNRARVPCESGVRRQVCRRDRQRDGVARPPPHTTPP